MITISIHTIVFISLTECFASTFHTEMILINSPYHSYVTPATPLCFDYRHAISCDSCS